MAQNTDMRSNDNRRYEDMDRDELMAIVGYDVDPDMSREELVALAIQQDNKRG